MKQNLCIPSPPLDLSPQTHYPLTMMLTDYLGDHGLTQGQFAKLIGMSRNRVCQVCMIGTDSLRLAEKIAEATNGAVTIEELRYRPRQAAE